MKNFNTLHGLWIITYKGKPITLERIIDKERAYGAGSASLEEHERESLLTSKTRKKVIALYLYHVGYTWGERSKGIDAERLSAIK